MTNLNPFTIVDSILADYASPRVRRLIHSLILLVVALVTIYLAADKEWKEFIISLGVTLYAAANKANTQPTDQFGNEDVTFYDGDPNAAN